MATPAYFNLQINSLNSMASSQGQDISVLVAILFKEHAKTEGPEPGIQGIALPVGVRAGEREQGHLEKQKRPDREPGS